MGVPARLAAVGRYVRTSLTLIRPLPSLAPERLSPPLQSLALLKTPNRTNRFGAALGVAGEEAVVEQHTPGRVRA